MSVLDFGLALAGMPEKTIQELDAQLPALERIALAAKTLEPHITAMMPTIDKVWPDIVAVTPLLLDLVTFIKQKQSA